MLKRYLIGVVVVAVVATGAIAGQAGAVGANFAKITDAQRATCSSRQDLINGLIAKYSSEVKNRQLILDHSLQRLSGYYENSLMYNESYDDLLDRAKADRKKAQDSVAVVTSVASISCQQDNPTEKAQDFMQNIGQAKNNLRAYKTSLQALIDCVLVATEGTEGDI